VKHTCEEWCHCRECGGFKPGGVPYGNSCSCEKYHVAVVLIPWEAPLYTFREKLPMGSLFWVHEATTGDLSKEKNWRMYLMAAFYALLRQYRVKHPVTASGGAFLEAAPVSDDWPLGQPDSTKPKTEPSPPEK
jgi:hypothetical protein